MNYVNIIIMPFQIASCSVFLWQGLDIVISQYITGWIAFDNIIQQTINYDKLMLLGKRGLKIVSYVTSNKTYAYIYINIHLGNK